jgi:hypothetical protein
MFASRLLGRNTFAMENHLWSFCLWQIVILKFSSIIMTSNSDCKENISWNVIYITGLIHYNPASWDIE